MSLVATTPGAAHCRHFGLCGGCTTPGGDEAARLERLRDHVVAALDAGGIPHRAAVPPPEPSPRTLGYRNKMEFTFGSRRFVPKEEPEGAPRDFALGLHVRGVWFKVLDIGRCEIQFPEANPILESVREIARRRRLPPWDVRGKSGLLRHLVLRKAEASGQILLNLVTSDPSPADLVPFFAEIGGRHPEISTLVQSVNRRIAPVSTGQEEIVHTGTGTIHETLCGLRFGISVNTFFQVNTPVAERLAGWVRDEAGADGRDEVWDLCSGSGSLALAVASRAGRVRGFELVADAVADARRNASLNGIANAAFEAADVTAVLRAAAEGSAERPGVVLVDPPRAGLHPRAVAALAVLRPRRIVWVSCDVPAAAPQLARLIRDGGYSLERIQPFDMFPHTGHVECAFSLRAATSP